MTSKMWIALRTILITVSCLTLGLLATACRQGNDSAAQDRPDVIRIGAPAVSGATQIYFGSVGIARAKGLFDKEFGHEGIRVEYIGFPNASLVAQALANGQLDLAAQGDMISIIARAGGTSSRLILPSGRYSNAFLAVPPNSSIRSVEDLRSKRVGYTKGNYIQLQAARILAAHGLKESDIRQVNLSPAAAAAALAAGQLDAVFQGVDILALRDKGLARIVYDTRGDPTLTGQSAILVRSDFADAHPELVYRVVKVLVQASRWGSDEANRNEEINIWKTGRPQTPLAEDYAGRPMREHLSPLLDPFMRARYEATETETERLGLLKAPTFPVSTWFDSRYLDRALKDLGLQHYWTPLDANGKPQGTGA